VEYSLEESPRLLLNFDKNAIPLMKAIGYLAAIVKGQEKAIDSLQQEIKALNKEIKQRKAR
jgi:peptidoglycan hydrolase CwlO-like protein